MGSKEKYFQAVDKEPPAFALSDADGRRVTLADFKGKVVVLHFIYAGCPDVCPLHADRIAEIQRQINASPMKALVQFVSITTDPAHDGPEVLRAYGPVHGLDAANWIFLTTAAGQPEDTTRGLAKAFGHAFTKTEGDYQVHGVVTHVIDRRGHWRANFHGLKFEPVNLVLYINGLVNEHARPPQTKRWWDKLRELF
jgi:protein SCO1/2